ncbi:MAG: NAD-dependent epimerase/dehydratase family protein [Acidihalobacter sp.]|uniref:NAD-dependent epimerase/dehydratase family protein n=1 Tax=Acidihalobacter sp. TaxID=1872108 RepID=UPI00307DEAAA
MNVLILGGTGLIGRHAAVAMRALGADVSILCRSAAGSQCAEALNCTPLDGDIAVADGGRWLQKLGLFDAVVHAAATFDEDMPDIDTRLLVRLESAMQRRHARRVLLYTGGVWLFGDTHGPADETAPHAPPPEWAWLSRNARRVMASQVFDGRVVHPANVVDGPPGAPSILIREAEETSEIRLPQALAATWPLVDARDIGALYALVLDAGRRGEDYIGAAVPAEPLAVIASRLATHLGLADASVPLPIGHWTSKYGAWASGYGLDQNLSAAKARQLLGWTPAFAAWE